ncbi:hypothetical protein HG264_13955 [Pseudomonas sp. gcc21]|uniref:hypothetical protein n=1 Tax=Pseudomonas sp. gcc21 TaxID=2726989 RepID=UPI001451ACE5|nr:hypothetical protein [Pseudomonas sp. gcc21]QJD59928.1 hypothetical protein HG264_13955 [Pseudomonas sp. gcc21]
MQLFRAIPSSRLAEAEQGLRRQSSIRVPRNVPYVVDNLWESLRPKNMPSRRHAIYASPTAELALQNASAPLADGDEYVPCRVVVDPRDIRVAQLQVKDARYHSDIRLVGNWVSQRGQVFADLSLTQKQKVAQLFLPGLHRGELTALWKNDPLIAEFCSYARQNLTLWSSASSVPQASDGELFFELLGDLQTYRLEAL